MMAATARLQQCCSCWKDASTRAEGRLCSKTMELVTFVRKLQGDLEVYTAAISNWFICRPCVMERYQNLAKNDSKKVVLSCSWVQLGVNRLRSDWLKIITRGSCTTPTYNRIMFTQRETDIMGICI